jgi:hypothetical protein
MFSSCTLQCQNNMLGLIYLLYTVCRVGIKLCRPSDGVATGNLLFMDIYYKALFCRSIFSCGCVVFQTITCTFLDAVDKFITHYFGAMSSPYKENIRMYSYILTKLIASRWFVYSACELAIGFVWSSSRIFYNSSTFLLCLWVYMSLQTQHATKLQT